MSSSLAEIMGRTSVEPCDVVINGENHLTQQGVVKLFVGSALESVDEVHDDLKRNFTLAMMTADWYGIEPALIAEEFAEERQQFLSDELLSKSFRALFNAQTIMQEVPPDGTF
jgi:hypothetical protein